MRLLRSGIVFAVSFLFGITSIAWANHQWENYHWAKSQLGVCNLAQDTETHLYRTMLTLEWAEWSAGTELNLVPDCENPDITFANADYGSTTWRGRVIPEAAEPHQHLQGAALLLNERHFEFKNNQCVQGVACHEIGHTLGLGHVSSGSCMDITWANWCNAFATDFDAHDAQTVNQINHGPCETEP